MVRFLFCALILTALRPSPTAAQIAYAWGNNSNGQLGNGSTTNFSNVPVAVSTAGVLNGLTITSVAVGGYQSFAVANGTLFSWGYNDNGQLGNGSTTSSSIPVAVSTAGVLNGLTVTAAAGGGNHSLALANGKVYAWGANFQGQLGNNSLTSTTVPVAVSTAGALNGQTVTAIAAGNLQSLALTNGRVYSWGDNFYGELGNGTTTNSSVPVAVSTAGVLNGQTVTAIAAGFYHGLALANGKVFAWGDNFNGQLGNNSTTNSSVPVAVSTAGVLNGLTVTAIAAGQEHSLAVANGKVYAWGDNSNGQLGTGTTTSSSVPVAVSSTLLNGLTVTKVAAGQFSSYALTNTGRLFAWGDNSYGELGLGSAANPVLTPQEVIAPSGYTWTDVEVGSCASQVLATVAPVPEPASLLLVLAAAGGLGRLLRRRARRLAPAK